MAVDLGVYHFCILRPDLDVGSPEIYPFDGAIILYIHTRQRLQVPQYLPDKILHHETFTTRKPPHTTNPAPLPSNQNIHPSSIIPPN